jgi:hypothetical protein
MPPLLELMVGRTIPSAMRSRPSPTFECSASSWTLEHLIRLQVVVFESQRNEQLFPAEWEVRDNDKALMTMDADVFFAPTADAVSKGKWDKEKPFHQFFLHLLQIQRASRTPSPRTSPRFRTMQTRSHAHAAKWYSDVILAKSYKSGLLDPQETASFKSSKPSQPVRSLLRSKAFS